MACRSRGLYKRHKSIGPGGIGCKCCRPYNTTKESVIRINKLIRTNCKLEIEEELTNIYII